ncbi:MAG: HipA domain-containing protein [Gammaproteobacteria bacterium]|nr:HipA domain-containing protein [Gammaproteobacteria bacterium]MBI5616174.1 HipA domain-containing protein [Gammaproteobacteria bacterium]
MALEYEVRYRGTMLATLADEGHGIWALRYEGPPAATEGPPPMVSMRLPPRSKPYKGPLLQSWMRNLLPGYEIRRLACRRLGLSQANDFALLGALGGDCQGAVSFHAVGEGAEPEAFRRALTDAEVRNLMAALPEQPLLVDVEGARLSLPGDHHKLPVGKIDDQIALAFGAASTTHILKPAKLDRSESVHNEAYCMAVARAAGLPVAATELRPGSTSILLVQRVDREASGEEVRRVHMEDFCQLRGLPPEQQFEREGGPGLTDCANLIRRYSCAPATDLRSLVAWIVFNFLIGNGGAFGKQLAMLHLPSGPRLAPFFGLQSTHVYADLSERLAMSVGKEDRPDWLHATRWRDCATEIGVKPAYVLQVLATMAGALPELAGKVADEHRKRSGTVAVIRDIKRLVERRARQVLVALQAEAA